MYRLLFLILSTLLGVSIPCDAQQAVSEHRKAILDYWMAMGDQQFSFEIHYGMAEMGPDWDQIDPEAKASIRVGIIRWQGTRYLFARETQYPGAHASGNRHCEWFDGIKTCRYNLNSDTGVMLSGIREEELPGARVLQGLIWKEISIVDVVEQGTFAGSEYEPEYRLDVDNAQISVKFSGFKASYPEGATIVFQEGARIRHIAYAEKDEIGIPHAVEISTISRTQVGTDAGTIRYQTRISTKREIPKGEFLPWFPQGARFGDYDTGEISTACSSTIRGLDAQVEAFERMGNPLFRTLKEAFDGILENQLDSDISRRQLVEASVSYASVVSKNELSKCDLKWRCATSVAYAALRSLDVSRDLSAPVLNELGNRVVSTDELKRTLEKKLKKNLAWRFADYNDILTLNSPFILLLGNQTAESEIEHVVLARLNAQKDRIFIFDYPRGLDNHNPEGYLERKQHIVLDFETEDPNDDRFLQHGHWGTALGIAFLLLALGIVRSDRQSKGSGSALCAVTLCALPLCLIGCSDKENGKEEGIFTVKLDAPPNLLPIGVQYRASFTVENQSMRECRIEVVSVSCGCLDAELESSVIKPGGTIRGSLIVSPGAVGPASNSVVLGSSASGYVTLELKYKGYAPLLIRPRNLRLSLNEQKKWGGEFEVLSSLTSSTPKVSADKEGVVVNCIGERVARADWGSVRVYRYFVDLDSDEAFKNGLQLGVSVQLEDGNRVDLKLPILKANSLEISHR